MEGFEKVVKVRVRDFSDLVRLAASGLMMGQPTYIIRFTLSGNVCVYGIMAVFKDFYKLYGVPLIYYWLDEGCRMPVDRNYAVIRSDETGEHVELNKGFKAGVINVPIINVQEVPGFIWDKEKQL
ncbi:MAG: hypothetical protein RMH84_02880 [Sulfolobales archaeon]|nr:hypothetical protein [Sulfolobales archaeon]MCX8208853.1 hypothetical protein [Sulfolobales archaeon]MDW8010520.1 hypothetical protein [Sulfolobales archaeon]